MDLIVDDAHLGTPEAEWTSSVCLTTLAPLRPLHPRRVVVVAPHPDDEILGTGGLLQTFIHQRIPIEIIAVTDGEASHPDSLFAGKTELGSIRTDESVEALRRIGCPDAVVRRLGLPDGHVGEHFDSLAKMLDEVLFPDDLCLAPWLHDGHPDHDACGEVVASIAGSTGTAVLSYLVWTWHWADPKSGGDLPWANCRRFELTRRMAARKRWATGAFPSQTRRPDGDRNVTAVLPPSVLRRFWRPFEVFVDGVAEQ
jgi:LmbE family N-acetylglucosaminyl deacetylase